MAMISSVYWNRTLLVARLLLLFLSSHGFSRAFYISETSHDSSNTRLVSFTRNNNHHNTCSSYPNLILWNVYGRGAEIWPESNEDTIQLSDSFPNGQVPYSAIMAIEQPDMNTVHERVEESIVHDDEETHKNDNNNKISLAKLLPTLQKETTRTVTSRHRQRPSKGQYMRRILKRAAAKEEIDTEGELTSVDKTPIVIAMSLVLRGLVRPMDILIAACLSTYFIILHMASQSTRDLTGAPILPATPPQGHVPTIISHPLGRRTEQSTCYDLWLKTGIIIGLIGPVALGTRYIIQGNIEAARVCARPLFILCCQVVTEAICRRNLTSLPLRILIPIVYSTSRLAYLWKWSTTAINLGIIGRGLGIVNIIYWSLNLFAFLIPIASIRYMRAHFFGVEAQEVTTRIGLEETVGMIPNYNSL